MKSSFFKKISFYLACYLFAIQGIPLAYANKTDKFDPHQISLAVIAYPSSVKDKPIVEETAESLRARLSQIAYIHVVESDSVNAIMNYNSDLVNTDTILTDGEKYLGLSKTHWFNREYPEAEATVNKAIESFRVQPSKGGLLLDAYLTKEKILEETDRYQESEEVFKEALKIDPSLTLEGLPITGHSKKIFKATRKDLLEKMSGQLQIETDPPTANVYLNGIKKGITPLTLAQLPEGSYLLTLEASHYQKINKPIVISTGTTQIVKQKLSWTNGKSGNPLTDYSIPIKSDEVIEHEIKMAVRIGETLKVDKVLLVSTERKDNQDLIVVRTIDTVLKAAYNPIGTPLADYLANKEQTLNKISNNITDQAKQNVLKNPEAYLDPDLGDIRVMRRKRPFTKTPLFYTLVGVVIGGAIGTTAGLLLGSNGSSGNANSDVGSIVVQFK